MFKNLVDLISVDKLSVIVLDKIVHEIGRRARLSSVWGRIYGAWVASPVGTRVRGTTTRAGPSGAPGVAATGPRQFCPPTSGAEIRAPNLYRHSRFS